MPSRASYRVYYDDQCEICQAGVSWLQTLDRTGLVECVALGEGEDLPAELDADSCLRELHVATSAGEIVKGAEAVALLARVFPVTRLVGVLAQFFPLSWLASHLYRAVALRRYALSKCRGGSCRVPGPRIGGAFWSCYLTGLLLRAPLIWKSSFGRLYVNFVDYRRTRRRRVDLLDGRLSLLFLGGWPCDLIPTFFGERFTMVLYRGLAIDPGSPRMRRSVSRHISRMDPATLRAVIATHHHEEHAGNLDWFCERTGAQLFAGPITIAMLQPAKRLPFIRSLLIGQPQDLRTRAIALAEGPLAPLPDLEVLNAPGHSDDHLALWDPVEKLLIAGDAFMGAYFATPNPDVDSRQWIETLERFLALDIEILVEGHGHIHTLREDVPDLPGIVIREHPRGALEEKLRFLRWVRSQIEAGMDEGLPCRMIEATCFPWGRRHTWENFGTDEATRLFSLGHFSRSELVRSFARRPGDTLPEVYEVRFRG